jgi:peptidoglycan/xylan/chitin deacetylase (PgdA/CDA1 family)
LPSFRSARRVGIDGLGKSVRRRRVSWFAALLTVTSLLIPRSAATAHPLTASSGPSTWSSCPAPASAAQFTAPPTAPRTVALTFDDGPGASTAQILSILLSYHVRATFFNIGLSEAARPSLVRAEAEDGFLVGDHTWSHPDLPTLTDVSQFQELAAAGAEQRSIVGSSPCSFRPPGGDYDATTTATATSQSMSEWLWNVDTQDWQARGSGATYWVHRIISLAESEGGAQDHPVVLLHDQSGAMPATVAALPTIIRYFLSRHYQFVDLLGRDGPPDSCRSTGGGFRAPARRFLTASTVLTAGHSLHSPDGQYSLTQAANGALDLVAGATVIWSTPTGASPGATARVFASGPLVVVSHTGRVLWRSPTGHRGDHLALADDGSISLVSGGTTWWDTHTHLTSLTPSHGLRPNWSVYSPDGQCRVTMTPTGRLVLQSAGYGTLWSSRGRLVAGALAVLERNGNLEITAPDRRVLWASGSRGPMSDLVVTNHGHVVVRAATGAWRWSNP